MAEFKNNGKLKLLIIVGTRPEIIRLAAVINKCRLYFDCLLAHTGQNYDYNLNGIFFKDLKLADLDVYMDAVGADLGETMGRFMAAELAATGFFRGIDVIIPVPLHPRKQKLRGYNQSECIARGVSAVTGIPIDVSSVLRRRHTETQTRKSAYERWENVDGIFLLRYPERFVGKHILIVDDVLTTGATTTACADALKDVGGVHVSILTLAVAGS